MIQAAAERAFDTFATSNESLLRRESLSELMAMKVVPKHVDDPRFERGFLRWSELASNAPSPEERLLAIAELVRIGQMVKKWQGRVTAALQPAFVEALPPASALGDADDRLNLARACAQSNANWMPEYLARSVAEEEQGEKARGEFMSALFERVRTVSEVLKLLSDAFVEVRPETESPSETIGRRLVRTFVAFRSSLLTSFIDAGTDVGAGMDALIRNSLRRSGRPQNAKVQMDLTRETALTIHDLVRTRFSLATEPQTFAALRYCRSFFPGINWPVDVRDVMAHLIQDISEALVLLGRQDVPNSGLLEQLELVCGLRERARVVATAIAEKHPELPERIRVWLRHGRLVNVLAASETLEESLLAAADGAIGLALIEARSLSHYSEIALQIASALEIYDPVLAARAGDMIRHMKGTCQSIEEVAKRRSLELLGKTGEEAEYSPKYFDVATPLGGRMVMVRRPAVVRTDSQKKAADVVLKGLAE
jgi:hypothetical protein